MTRKQWLLMHAERNVEVVIYFSDFINFK
jgi:hypothetical protein